MDGTQTQTEHRRASAPHDRAPAPAPGRAPDRLSERLARVLTWVWSLAAVVMVLLWVLRLTGPIRAVPVMVLGALNIPVGPSLVSVLLVALLAAALQRRMRVALVATAVSSLLGAVISALILTGQWTWSTPLHEGIPRELHVALEVLGVGFGLAGVAAAVRARASFPGLTRPGALPAALGLGVLGAAVSASVMQLLLVLVLPDPSRPDPQDLQLLGQVLGEAIGLRAAGMHALGTAPLWIAQVGGVLLSATLLCAVWSLFRAGRRTAGWTGETELALRGLLARWGDQDSLGWFATRRDKEVIFSPDGRAAIAFRAIGATCLASGDPVGDPRAWPAAVTAWKRHAQRYGLVPGAISVSEAGARAYAHPDAAGGGLAVTAMGDEAVLDPERFTLSSTDLNDIRRAVRRARRGGLSVTVRRQREVPGGELLLLGELADAWRGDEPDRGFSMALNRWADPADDDCVLVVAAGPEGLPVGLLSLVPWGARGLSLDVMRHDPDAVNGVSELMIAELMAQTRRLGVHRVSLNFAMFRSVFEDADRLGAGALTRFNSGVLGRLDRFFQLERLYRFNDRFHPEWVPRYAVFESLLTLPRTAVAAGAAEGFLPSLPRAAERGVRRRDGRSLSAEQLERLRVLQRPADPPPGSEAAPEQGAGRRTPQQRHRRADAEALRAAGAEPWPLGVRQVLALARARELIEAPPAAPVPTGATAAGRARLRTAGRVRAHRDHGGVVFLELIEGRERIQALVERDRVGAQTFELVRRRLDDGDLVLVEGVPGRSRTGTPSLLVDTAAVAAKSLREVPFDGFEDPEARLRHRSLDLLVHPDRLELLRLRTTTIRAVRRFLEDRGLDEVETPVLSTVHGGATARPFTTWINAYGMPLSLRIAPELHLKRLLVGGSGPIFEIARNFRNEGADATHNPEFTALEAYVPWADYTDMRELTEQLVKAAATAVHGAPVLPLRPSSGAASLPAADGTSGAEGAALLDISGPWAVRTVTEAVSEAVGRPVGVDTDIEVLLGIAREHRVPVGPGMGPGAVLEELYGELVEPSTVAPTFYCDFPAETSPLTAPHRTQPGLVERWDLVIGGMELGTAYSELTDPVLQRRRLTAQSLKAAAGDPEAMEVDEEFLAALELGMPPTGGLGIGLDRLVMLLGGATIREVLAFPFVRPLR